MVRSVSILLGISEGLESLMSGSGGQETRLVCFPTGAVPGRQKQKTPDTQARDRKGGAGR